MKTLVRALLISLGLFTFGSAIAEIPAQDLQQKSISGVLATAMPAVVNITVQGQLPTITDPFLKKELQKHYKNIQINGNKFVSIGSGVIIDAKQGLIVTNAHVVDQARSVIVTLKDGRRSVAKILGHDDGYDVALLQIHADHLTALPFAKPNSLKVGDFVATIGSPFGLTQTVTSGIVSALNRSDLGIEGYENFIQTDAPINMGNSGGALINLQGQLVGINTALVGPDNANVGIGFAIPASIVNNIAHQLAQYGKVERGLLGVQVQNLSPDLADAFKVSGKHGALVTHVMPYSPAAQAGLEAGDIITNANGTTLTNGMEIRNIVGLMRTGSKISLTVLRDEKKLTLHTSIDTTKASKMKMRLANPYLFGVTTHDVIAHNPSIGFIKGAQATDVDYDSPATIAGLLPGDIIVSANHKPVNNVEDLETAAKASKNGLLLRVLRAGGSFYIVIK